MQIDQMLLVNKFFFITLTFFVFYFIIKRTDLKKQLSTKKVIWLTVIAWLFAILLVAIFDTSIDITSQTTQTKKEQ